MTAWTNMFFEGVRKVSVMQASSMVSSEWKFEEMGHEATACFASPGVY